MRGGEAARTTWLTGNPEDVRSDEGSDDEYRPLKPRGWPQTPGGAPVCMEDLYEME